MALILLVLLALLFFGLGFALHALWIVAVILFVAWIIGWAFAGANRQDLAGSGTGAGRAPACDSGLRQPVVPLPQVGFWLGLSPSSHLSNVTGAPRPPAARAVLEVTTPAPETVGRGHRGADEPFRRQGSG